MKRYPSLRKLYCPHPLKVWLKRLFCRHSWVEYNVQYTHYDHTPADIPLEPHRTCPLCRKHQVEVDGTWRTLS